MLEQEVGKLEGFKIYTESNCKYQCRVVLAGQECGCIPWDFIHGSKAEECDVFGRTCFFNKMKIITQAHNEVCKHCVNECDLMKFQKLITRINDLSPSYYGGKFFKRPNSNGKSIGNKAFIDLLEDANGTITEKVGLRNAYSTFYKSFDDEYPLDKYSGFIVIHLTFKKPDVMVISPKYSVFDMIGVFGGQFSLFEKVTGASFLGLINLIILLIKLMFPSQN